MHLYLYNHTLYESYWCMIHVSIWILYDEWGGSGDGGGGGNLRKHVVYDTLIIFYKDEHDQVSFFDGH